MVEEIRVKGVRSWAVVVAALLLSAGIGLGLLSAGYLISTARLGDRFVEVKGFDERIVKSDYASWMINYKSTGATLEVAVAGIEKSQNSIVDFLSQNGFAEKDIERGLIKITDKQADAYSNNISVDNRYVADSSITIRTDKVDEIVALSQKTLDLAKTGVTISADYGNQGPRFEYRSLNAIKPEMIAKATKSAREAANQFAKDSGSNVGSIRNASQGYFTVEPLSADGQSSLNQKIRVVSTIQFYLGE